MQNRKGKVYFTMRNIDTAQKLNNLRRVFFTIKKKTNEIISNYDDVNYLEDPSVDIKKIAEEIGIAGILPVPPEEINYLHAILDDSDKERIVIKVNDDDSDEEKLFSIAHEIEHYIRKKTAQLKKADVFKKNVNLEKKDDVLRKANEFISSDAFAARSSPSNYKEAIRDVERIKHSKYIANYIAETVSENLGKNVSIKQAYKEWAKALLYDSIWKNKASSRFNEQFILHMINKLYDEEMADYFAANLLVPVERFILWEEKSDSKIAKAFKVSKACIKKRREEIKYELEFITSKYISSGDKTE